MGPPHGVYVVRMTRVSVSSNITLVQLKSATANGLEIIEATCEQDNSTTSAMLPVQLLIKSAAATVTSFTPIPLNQYSSEPSAPEPSGTSATGTNASAEGTDGAILYERIPNVLNGFSVLPVPEARIVIPGGGLIVAMKLPVSPASALTITAQIVYRSLY